jgi:hypothetical protein
MRNAVVLTTAGGCGWRILDGRESCGRLGMVCANVGRYRAEERPIPVDVGAQERLALWDLARAIKRGAGN